jgi:pimeloyl-ACP methyl ester carboxylesterase
MTTITPTHHVTPINGFAMHHCEAGSGDAVVLLHGWPQTSRQWQHVMPALAEQYRVIAPDLRGSGDSGKPLDGYDKRTMASDVAALLDALGVARAHVVGHDFGATVAYALAATHRERVRSLSILEMLLPGFGYEHAMQITPQGGLWHFSFHLQPDIPEMLIAGKEREYLTYFVRNHVYDPTAVSEADIDDYVRCLKAPGGLRAGLNYYRTIFQDSLDNQEFAKTKLTIPVLALGGANSLGEHTRGALMHLSDDVRGGAVEHCGHWMADERPDYLVETLPAFFSDAA